MKTIKKAEITAEIEKLNALKRENAKLNKTKYVLDNYTLKELGTGRKSHYIKANEICIRGGYREPTFLCVGIYNISRNKYSVYRAYVRQIVE